jgi:hypothetical protein
MVRGCVSLAAEGNDLLLLELSMEEVEGFWRRMVFLLKQSAGDYRLLKQKGKKKEKKKELGFYRG